MPSETRPGDEPARHGQAEAQDAGDGHDDAERRQVGPVARAHLVDRLPGQPRDRDREDHRQRGQAERDPDPLAVRPQEGQQAGERPHFTKDSVGAVQRLGAGLCDHCVNQRIVTTTRESAFSLCEKSREDARFPKYPRIPVGACPGFTRRAEPGPA
jgi:hypothetical protein